MTQKKSETLQYLGFYQLENLRRQQTKFFLVALANSSEEIPAHSLLKPDFVLGESVAAEKIGREIEEKQLPKWWPIILISKSGEPDAAIAEDLASKGLTNIFSYKNGWTSLAQGL